MQYLIIILATIAAGILFAVTDLGIGHGGIKEPSEFRQAMELIEEVGKS